MRFSVLMPFACVLLTTVGAEARRLPGPTVLNGPNCHALARATGQGDLVVGTVLGGRQTHRGNGGSAFVDYRTFQGCFVSQAACERWTSGLARQRSIQPGYNRCTPVYVGLKPKR